MRVLIADDQASVARAVAERVRASGWQAEIAEDADEAVELLNLYDFDIAIVDNDLLGDRDLNVVRLARKAKIDTPIMVMAYACPLEVRVAALNAGADHVLAKPFHLDELVAWVEAITRRARGLGSSVVTVGAIEVDTLAKVVRVDGDQVHMTAKHFAIMDVFASRVGQTLTKQAIMDHVYGGRDEPEIKIVDVFICKLRKILGAAGGQIVTVWGQGYALRDAAPVERAKPVGEPRLISSTNKAKALLALNAQGEMTTAGIRVALGGGKIAITSSTLSLLSREGLTVKRTHGHVRAGRTTHVITGKGLAWLRENGLYQERAA